MRVTVLGVMVAALCAGLMLPGRPAAQEAATLAAVAPPAGAASGPVLGAVTRLPLPRFVSLKSSEVAARRGPSREHRRDWVYRVRGLPVRVTAEFEHWRRIEDIEGQGGWVFYTQLSGVRTVLVTQDMAPMFSRPMDNAPEVALLEAGVVGRIMECGPVWCRLNIEGTRGWVNREALWGLEPGEVLD